MIFLFIYLFCTNLRSSLPKMFCKKNFLENLSKFTGKHFFWSLFWYNCRPQAFKFFKKRLQHICFRVKFAKFLRTLLLKNTSGQILLKSDGEVSLKLMNKLEFNFLFRELFRGQQLITDISHLVQNTFEKTQVST